MKRVSSILIALAMSSLLAACAVQPVWVPLQSRWKAPEALANFGLGGRIIKPRANGPYASADVVFGLPQNSGFSVRQALVGGGYRLLSVFDDHLSLELGGDLGMGQPMHRVWSGTGLYVGASSALLLRIGGMPDSQVGYAPMATQTDVVFGLRGGVWNPAVESRLPLLEGAVYVGLRLSFISDLAVANNRSWQR